MRDSGVRSNNVYMRYSCMLPGLKIDKARPYAKFGYAPRSRMRSRPGSQHYMRLNFAYALRSL